MHGVILVSAQFDTIASFCKITRDQGKDKIQKNIYMQIKIIVLIYFYIQIVFIQHFYIFPSKCIKKDCVICYLYK